MQSDAVHTYHWMSNAQFLNGVALGQVTPGPVVATVAAVGYAAHGVPGGLLAALVAIQLTGPNGVLHLDVKVPAVLLAAVLAALRAPFIVCVVAGALAAALLRAFLQL